MSLWSYLVRSRSHKLQLLNSSTDIVPSGGNSSNKKQTPVRLANGAIAKSSIASSQANKSHLQKNENKQAVKKSPKVLQNTALREKFVPVSLTGGASNSIDYSCVKCGAVFTNEKLMEKHYALNHEFRCKFCELVLDKDNYGVHLRQHLAKERRKNQ